MARKTNKAQVQAMRVELQRAKQKRQTEGYDDVWDRMVDLYRGRQLEGMTEDDKVVINVAFAVKNMIAPSIAVNNPKFTVEAQKPESAAQAIITEEILNYIWRVNKYKRQFRLAVDDFLIVGHGWIKTGYKFVKEAVTTGQYEADSPATDYGNDEAGVDDRDETAEGNVETEMNIVTDRPFIERVSFRDIYVDPDARNMDEICWIAQRVRRRVADVKVDKRYQAAIRSQVTGNKQDRYEQENHSSRKVDGIDGTNVPGSGGGTYVDVYEYYDVKRNQMCVFTELGTDGFLIPPKKVDYAFGHPFLMLRNYDVPDEFYPLGELEAMESLQNELNMTRTQMFNHRKRYARKYLVMPEAFDDAGLAALESDEDNTMVMMTPNTDASKAIVPMPTITTPPEFYNQSDIIQADIRQVTATDEYMRGDMPNVRRTATEAAMIQDAANARSADKLAQIENFLAECGERVIALMQQYMTQDDVIRVVGTTGMNTTWVNYDSSYIEGDFDFQVEAGSTQPRNESFRRQSANQLVQMMAPFVGAQVVDMTKLAVYALREFGVKNPESFIQAPPPPPPAPGAPPMDPNADPNAQGAPTPPPGVPNGDPGSFPGVPPI